MFVRPTLILLMHIQVSLKTLSKLALLWTKGVSTILYSNLSVCVKPVLSSKIKFCSFSYSSGGCLFTWKFTWIYVEWENKRDAFLLSYLSMQDIEGCRRLTFEQLIFWKIPNLSDKDANRCILYWKINKFFFSYKPSYACTM